jgi:Radical SAM superfamily
MMRDAGVVWLQITGGEPTIDKDFPDAYRLAFELGMMLTVSTNGSRLWRPNLLEMLTGLPPYRLVISLYGATEAAYDGLTQRRGSYKAFRRGIAATLEAGLPVRLNIVVTDVSATRRRQWSRWPRSGASSTTSTRTSSRPTMAAGDAAGPVRGAPAYPAGVHRLQRRAHVLPRRPAREGVDLQDRPR